MNEREDTEKAFRAIEARVMAKIRAEMERLRNDGALRKLMEDEIKKTLDKVPDST